MPSPDRRVSVPETYNSMWLTTHLAVMLSLTSGSHGDFSEINVGKYKIIFLLETQIELLSYQFVQVSKGIYRVIIATYGL